MKKYLLIICVLILGLVLNASMDHAQDSPTAQGGSLVAGAFSFSSAGGALFEEEGERFNIIQFNPSISYFIAPGLAIGGKLIFHASWLERIIKRLWDSGRSSSIFLAVLKQRLMQKAQPILI